MTSSIFLKILSHIYWLCMGKNIYMIICYLMMPLVVAWKPIKKKLHGPRFGVKFGKIFEIFGEHQLIISLIHDWRKVIIYLIMHPGVAYMHIERGVTMTKYFW